MFLTPDPPAPIIEPPLMIVSLPLDRLGVMSFS
jgi:hypothetical protein